MMDNLSRSELDILHKKLLLLKTANRLVSVEDIKKRLESLVINLMNLFENEILQEFTDLDQQRLREFVSRVKVKLLEIIAYERDD
ncbi:MAG: hypothetical protein QXV44_02450 [Candidatus Anstonellaceae archaeon]